MKELTDTTRASSEVRERKLIMTSHFERINSKKVKVAALYIILLESCDYDFFDF